MSGKRAREVSSPPKTPPSAYDRKSFWDAGFEAKKWAMQYRKWNSAPDAESTTSELSEDQMTALAHLGNFDIDGFPLHRIVKKVPEPRFTMGVTEPRYVMIELNGNITESPELMRSVAGATRFRLNRQSIYMYNSNGFSQKLVI